MSRSLSGKRRALRQGGCLLSACLLVLALPSIAPAQGWPDTGADAVESFTPGTGAGYGAQYFPGNVLGLPDSTGRGNAATVEPRQILSLGIGGAIVLRFDRAPIVDIPGPDFTVFENAFDYVAGGRTRRYAEPGEVAVSRDGITFIAFPYDSLTLRGCAGVTPTSGDHDPGDPALSGGDAFDLHDIGIDSVRYVRVRDVTAIVKNNTASPFWDITLNGFDLDAVVRTTVSRPRQSGVDAPIVATTGAAIVPNPFPGSGTLALRLPSAGRLRVRLLDLLGRDVMVIADRDVVAGQTRIAIDAGGLPEGFYLIAVEEDGRLVATITARHIR